MPPKRFRVALLCKEADRRRIESDLDSVSTVKEIRPLRDAAMKAALAGERSVTVVSSDVPGLGKTEAIKARAHRDELELCTVVISGLTSRDEIVRSLYTALHSKGAIAWVNALHINILDVPVACAEEVHDILFEMLYLSMVSGRTTSAVSLIHVNQPTIFIELANMVAGDELHDANMANRDLKFRLPLCRYLQEPTDHLSWDPQPERLIISAQITSDAQVVLNFLKLLREGSVDNQILRFGDYGVLPDEAAQLQRPATPIRANEALELLAVFFFAKIEEKGQQPSFSLVHSFLAFLAAQLRKFTICSSSFYRTDFLPDPSIRSTIVRGLVATAVRFAARSRSGEGSLAERVAPQSFDTIDYLLLLIQPAGGLTPFYRNVAAFEQEGEGEARGALARWYAGTTPAKRNPDYAIMPEAELKESLVNFLGPKSSGFIKSTRQYALTGDNVLKMMLVHVRVTASLPVVIMGETGCGKTSLLKYLQQAACIPDDNFLVLNIHAGIGKPQIIAFVREAEQHAQNTNLQVWCFFDEANTSEELSMISEIVCSRKLEGIAVDPLVVFICAVNPYRERTREIQVIGLASKLDLQDPMRKLVYRVHLLPEAMLDYVFDYGSPTPADEQRYIQSMLQESLHPELETKLVVASQNFIRDPNNFGEDCSVSLRDVRRYKKLVQFFRGMRQTRSRADDAEDEQASMMSRATDYLARSTGARQDARRFTKYGGRSFIDGRREEEIAIVLALALCYHSRLPTSEARYDYRMRISEVWNQHWRSTSRGFTSLSAAQFLDLLEVEQKDILERMLMNRAGSGRQLRKDWEGTAMNGALLENVFVLMVCILNRIPVFLVGKPGSSKSLSMKLIYRSSTPRKIGPMFLSPPSQARLPICVFYEQQSARARRQRPLLPRAPEDV